MPEEMQSELERVEAFRVERFHQMGFDMAQAIALARSDADLHKVEALLLRGCPHNLAYSISK